MSEIFYDIFSDLPRQGPGNKKSTLKALQILDQIPQKPDVADIGCGTGAQTLCLAEQLGGSITAIDNHQPYLDVLELEAERLGYQNINCRNESMFQLSLEKKSLDLVWAEGSIYIIGFERGLKEWQQLLRPKGYMVVSEVCWLKNDIPDEVQEFWEREYPEIKKIEDNCRLIENSKFALIDYFTLAPTAWWDNFYIPLEERLKAMRSKYENNDDALELIEMVQFEIDLYRKYPDCYSYVFFVMQK